METKKISNEDLQLIARMQLKWNSADAEEKAQWLKAMGDFSSQMAPKGKEEIRPVFAACLQQILERNGKSVSNNRLL